MTKNLIPVIAKELGVEIGEEFEVSAVPEVIYRFTETRLECVPVNSEFRWEPSTLSFNHLITTEIIKLPFKPKDCEDYWTYNFERFSIVKTCWRGTAMDYACKFAGIVFRTGKEALIARPAKYKELTGKEWEEWEEWEE